MKGWIRLHRKVLDNPVVMKDAEYFAVWVYILLHASHGDCDVVFGKERISLHTGQLLPTSRKKIAEDLHISESKVERILKTFENEHQIEQQKTNKNRLISLVNWQKYQLSEQQIEQQVNNNRTTSEQQVNTINNINNINNGNKEKDIPPKSPKKKITGEPSLTKEQMEKMVIDSDLPGSVKEELLIFVQYKIERGDKYKNTGFGRLINQINKYCLSHGEKNVIDCMELSMSNNWQGIIWDKIKELSGSEKFMLQTKSKSEEPKSENDDEEWSDERWEEEFRKRGM